MEINAGFIGKIKEPDNTLSGLFQSGQQDLNLRPHGPQPCALPSYAIPRNGVYYSNNRNKIQLFFQKKRFLLWCYGASLLFTAKT